ncbi:NAD(P)H-hydrate dehydratase [Biformimicrobium ophioploci]|uniref:Bifunctional NAD(P)H-hydrate repair enzyme n=1 Tax=Biformimicrobium ophioploci TaxID=3036711 RepID=A0ABQ6LUW4_9GAMM|nr:NAD(P)H-hydrate dehydratase [Microbulbifer sp. NKW57]GMG85886.1 bifunctional ADP-dependent NAD(P)H-hydrate dehydratase/NAD(P)H-hydrate epimerase [Microbulbifer sp. NKW57]
MQQDSPYFLSLYSAAAVRAMDSNAIDNIGISGSLLMKRAGRAVFEQLQVRWPDCKEITVYCGGGNNGGDGYVVAAIAAQRGLRARVAWLVAPDELKGDARAAMEFARQEGVEFLPRTQLDDPAGVLVDAMLGTGFSGELRAEFAASVQQVNSSGLPVIAADIPSGVEADTGHAPLAVRADCTVTFIGRKAGLYTGAGGACAGEIVFDDLGVPAEVREGLEPLAHQYGGGVHLAPRPADAHKNLYGTVLVVGGDSGYGGAAMIAAEASARTGAGLVRLATRPEHVNATLARVPEVMASGVVSGQELEPLLEAPSVIALGPGLGQRPWGEQMLARAGRAQAPLVVDADALNILAGGRVLAGVRRDDWVLTPHPGEAARLLGCSSAEIGRDRLGAAKALQEKFSGVVLLKGYGTVIAHKRGCEIVRAGNPGMASGGMGDLLTGIIAGLMAQGLSPLEAAYQGAWVHGEAADRVAAQGMRGMLATDLLPVVREIIG